jgi:hypothetical protein
MVGTSRLHALACGQQDMTDAVLLLLLQVLHTLLQQPTPTVLQAARHVPVICHLVISIHISKRRSQIANSWCLLLLLRVCACRW